MRGVETVTFDCKTIKYFIDTAGLDYSEFSRLARHVIESAAAAAAAARGCLARWRWVRRHHHQPVLRDSDACRQVNMDYGSTSPVHVYRRAAERPALRSSASSQGMCVPSCSARGSGGGRRSGTAQVGRDLAGALCKQGTQASTGTNRSISPATCFAASHAKRARWLQDHCP